MATYDIHFFDGNGPLTVEAENLLVLDAPSGSVRLYIKGAGDDVLEGFLSGVRSAIPTSHG